MADYKLTNNNTVIRVSDEATIPMDSGNRDYQTYLAWVAEDNVADEADIIDPWVAVRQTRNSLLKDCDWTQLSDSPLSIEDKALWATYREELRNVPEDNEDPENITWPVAP